MGLGIEGFSGYVRVWVGLGVAGEVGIERVGRRDVCWKFRV